MFYAGLGKRPIRLRGEVPRYVANRMQVVLYREAIHLVLEGVVVPSPTSTPRSPTGRAWRWALSGPHMAHHLAGGRAGMLRHLLEHIGPSRCSAGGGISAGRSSRPRSSTGWSRRSRRPRRRPIARLEAERDALLVALLETLQTTRRQLAERAQGDGS